MAAVTPTLATIVVAFAVLFGTQLPKLETPPAVTEEPSYAYEYYTLADIETTTTSAPTTAQPLTTTTTSTEDSPEPVPTPASPEADENWNYQLIGGVICGLHLTWTVAQRVFGNGEQSRSRRGRRAPAGRQVAAW